MKNKNLIFFLIFIVIIISFVITHPKSKPAPLVGRPTTETNMNSAYFACDGGKTITAEFKSGIDVPGTETTPPIPGGTAGLALSDGRNINLHQTISADGVRYANPDESFVFWSKGNGALVSEKNQEKDFVGCVSVKPDTAGLPEVYQNKGGAYSLRYPTGYSVDTSYKYPALGPGKEIYGTKFTIDPSIMVGTNLSTDSYISVETLPRATTCTATLFAQDLGGTETPVNDAGTEYSMIATGDAGAGNRYDEIVYAIPGTNPCTAVRYFMHYTTVANYPTGTVKEFDKAAFLDQFDAIRRSLTLNSTP